MLEIERTAVSLDEKDLMELKRIVTDGDEKESFAAKNPVAKRVRVTFYRRSKK